MSLLNKILQFIEFLQHDLQFRGIIQLNNQQRQFEVIPKLVPLETRLLIHIIPLTFLLLTFRRRLLPIRLPYRHTSIFPFLTIRYLISEIPLQFCEFLVVNVELLDLFEKFYQFGQFVRFLDLDWGDF